MAENRAEPLPDLSSDPNDKARTVTKATSPANASDRVPRPGEDPIAEPGGGGSADSPAGNDGRA